MPIMTLDQLKREIQIEKVNLQSKYRLKVEKMWFNKEITTQERDDMFTLIGEAFHT